MTQGAYITAEDALIAIMGEFAKNAHNQNKGSFSSTHEGLGVIREEYIEFENDIFDDKPQDACKEAVQIAAAALQFIIDFKQPFDLQSCMKCEFAPECFGPREHGCRRYPEISMPDMSEG